MTNPDTSTASRRADDRAVVNLDAEKLRSITAEAARLANLPSVEWRFQLDRRAKHLGISSADLRAAVLDIVKGKEKKASAALAEERRQEQRAEKQRAATEREQKREREREQRQIEKDAERKSKEKQKAFAAIIKLPCDHHEAKLTALAKRLDEDVATLREEFSDFVDTESSATPASEWHVEPWEDPVAMAALLPELTAKISKHVVARPHEILTIGLWAAMAWIHEIAATHSPFLVATSAEPDSGKTTLLGVVGCLVPKPFTAVESTGPSIYRFVDREKPTLLVDEADDLFQRKADVKHIFNAAWTRGTKIPRQVQGVTVWFDPFCPKVVSLLGMNLPRALVGRSIVIKLWPKKPDEKVENFSHTDDDEFANLRRRLARWAADNATAIKEAKPVLPPNFNNRLAANWKLIHAIAEAAGGGWPKSAREAAERLARTTRKPSWGQQMLAAFQGIFATGRTPITSKDVVAELNVDHDAPWCEYHGGPITQRQVADILEQYDIHPVVIHPTKRSSLSPRGYKLEQFRDVFERFLRPEPHIRTSGRKSRR